mgnify:CR=1 FL=1
MKPEKNIMSVQIPLTFDGSYKNNSLTNDKFILSGVILFVWIVTVVISIFTANGLAKIFYPLISFVVVTTFVRFVVLREHYYKKKKDDLLAHDFIYDNNVFWDIYEVTASYPHICRYTNGTKAIFVQFDKDVIVGQDDDNDYYHYEAISDAYLQMSKRGISCVHIDYMDTVGKDDRMDSLFEMSNNSENSDLRTVLIRVFENVMDTMKRSYASYDVYCFMFNGKDELFWDELQIVIDYFCEANYIRFKILGREEIGELVKSVMNLDRFSVSRASEKLFAEVGGTSYIKPIWVERGYERKILNKTREELDEERAVKEVEKGMKEELKKKKRDKRQRLREKLEGEEEIDLFE